MPVILENNQILVSLQENGRWRLSSCRNPGFGAVEFGTTLFFDGAWHNLFGEGSVQRVEAGRVTVTQILENGLCARGNVSLLPDASGMQMEVELQNTSGSDIALGPLHMLEISGERPLHADSGWKAYVDSGGGWWAGAVDIESISPFSEAWELLPGPDRAFALGITGAPPERGFHNSSGGISALYNPHAGAGLLLSFLTWKRASGNVTWIYSNEEESVCGWAGCNFAGFRLKPGESISSEKLYAGIHADLLSGLEEYAGKAAELMNVQLPSIPSGWCSWYAHRLKIDEDITLANAKTIKERLPEYLLPIVQVDHGWQAGNICGDWLKTNERFPGGIACLADNLRQMGLNLGLWIPIFTVLESAPLVKEHPEYLVKDGSGRPKVLHAKWAWPPHDRIYYLDPTHPGAQNFIKETLAAIRKMGVHYWKIDFTWGIADNDDDTLYHDRSMVKGAEVYRKGLALVNDVLGDDYIYWCSNPINLGFGLGATSMSACDIGNPGFSRKKEVEGRIENLQYFRRNATTIISRYFLHKRLILLNPDVVEVGEPGNLEEARIRLSLVALSGGQTFLGDDLPSLSKERWNLLRKCLPQYGECARPVDMFRHTYPHSHPQIWRLHISKDWGEWDIVGLFNLKDEAVQVELPEDELGLLPGREYIFYEFWTQKLLGIGRALPPVHMEPVTTRLLMIKEVPAHPMVLSTDMHFTQGAVELGDVSFDSRSCTLRGRAVRQKGETGRIYVYVPDAYVPEDRPDMEWNGNIAALDIRFDRAAVNWRVGFKLIEPEGE